MSKMMIAGFLLLAVAALAHRAPRGASPTAARLEGFQTVAISPDTGRFTLPDADLRAALAAGLGDAATHTTDGLLEIDSSVAGGGRIVHLQGRFASSMVALVGADGALTQECMTPGCVH